MLSAESDSSPESSSSSRLLGELRLLAEEAAGEVPPSPFGEDDGCPEGDDTSMDGWLKNGW